MRKRLLLLTLCGVLLLSAVACGEETEQKPTTQTQPTTEESYTISYVPDETINRFLLTLKERSALTLPEVSQGNTPGEYVLTLSGCQITLSASYNGMGVIIQSGSDEGDQKLLINAFTHIVNAADKSCTKDQLNAAITFMKEQTSASSTYRVCNEVKIVSYLPSVKVGGSATGHRLDLVLLNYRKVETPQ